jgi:hypothetical protein
LTAEDELEASSRWTAGDGYLLHLVDSWLEKVDG